MLEFAICFKGDIPPERTMKLAKAAEKGGFSYVWTFDSHILWKECYTMLTYLATGTEKVKLGPCVTNPAVRDLTVTASNFAALNLISKGRAVCGIGRGDSSRRVMGFKPTTVDEMMAGVEKIRTMAAGGKVEHEGKEQWFNWANPKYPLPMWIAGYGPKVLRASAKHADGIVLQIADPFLVKWFISQVVDGAKECGRDAGDIEIMVAAPVFISKDLKKCRAQVRWFPAMVGNHVADLVERYHSGEVPQALTDYIKGRKGYDYRHHADKDADHLDFIPEAIVDRFSVIGDVDAHVAKLRELEAGGMTQFNIYLMCGEEERIVETYSKEIIPEFRKKASKTKSKSRRK
ncbi:MAG: LLM class F420-dependent oxidoreductase [Candidatus Lindowbacteria bacterium RIFCSPLOWO2_12_FULL_62_27]|nr:MAG: LLM class F420-dependent oxidoreductase [Candidatus Lindowbacteria bacterium RIFCSPLOWO2_02_FULL_62_12]OGH62666.1 MAG: LLM class F420-dependent oxidoreductase [Candidatus Lindowbacteria bacterium RIFCSPLOWO2_12_FULL_62_27]